MSARQRTPRTPNPLGVAICAAAVIGTLALLVALQHPEFFLYYLGIGAVMGLLALGLAAAEFRDQRDTAIRQADNAALKVRAAELERDIANGLLARYKAGARVVVPIRRNLRAIPTQREASDNDWPTNTDGAMWSRLYDEKGELR